MEAMMDEGRAPGFPRWMALAMYGGFAAGAALTIAGSFVARAVGIAAMLGAFALTYRLYKSPFWRSGNCPESRLDEREVRIRDRAYLRAYRSVAIIPMLVMLYTALALDDGGLAPYLWLPHTYREANILFWGVFLVTMTLPSVMLAWEGQE